MSHLHAEKVGIGEESRNSGHPGRGRSAEMLAGAGVAFFGSWMARMKYWRCCFWRFGQVSHKWTKPTKEGVGGCFVSRARRATYCASLIFCPFDFRAHYLHFGYKSRWRNAERIFGKFLPCFRLSHGGGKHRHAIFGHFDVSRFALERRPKVQWSGFGRGHTTGLRCAVM
jgi:hypothetical protein